MWLPGVHPNFPGTKVRLERALGLLECEDVRLEGPLGLLEGEDVRLEATLGHLEG